MLLAFSKYFAIGSQLNLDNHYKNNKSAKVQVAFLQVPRIIKIIAAVNYLLNDNPGLSFL